jgi:hypothetical protein
MVIVQSILFSSPALPWQSILPEWLLVHIQRLHTIGCALHG